MLTREKERNMKVKLKLNELIEKLRNLDIELPDPPKPEVKTPGQIVYEAHQDTRLVGSTPWLSIVRDAKNRYHAAAHKLGVGLDQCSPVSLPYLEPEAKPEPMTPGEAAHAGFIRNQPRHQLPWELTSSNEKLAWECAAQDAITFGRGDRVTR